MKVKTDKKEWVATLTHIIVIVILFFLPEMLVTYFRPGISPRVLFGMYFKALMYVTVFYVNYYVIIRRTLFNERCHRRVLKFLFYNVCLVAVAVTLINIMWRIDLSSVLSSGDSVKQNISEKGTGHVCGMPYWRYMAFIIRDTVVMIFTVALSLGLVSIRNWVKYERRQMQLMAANRVVELDQLKSQLNPHFLFNTLNSIYSLIDIAPEEARVSVHKLSKLLRYVLYETPDAVPLEKEVEFVRNYVALMTIRLGGKRVDFCVDIPDEAKHLPIAPLLFIPIVENAFKHGNTGNSDDVISIRIAYKDGVVVCETRNRIVHSQFESEDNALNRDGGIGIANLRRRLHLIYGENASLDVESTSDEHFIAKILLKQLQNK